MFLLLISFELFVSWKRIEVGSKNGFILWFLIAEKGLISETRIELQATEIACEIMDPPEPATWWIVNNINDKKGNI